MASKSTKKSGTTTKARPQAPQSSPIDWLAVVAKTAGAKAEQLRQQAGAAR